MEYLPWLWFYFAAIIINVALVGFGLWLAWTVATAIRGVHVELKKIRVILERDRGVRDA